MNEKKVIVQHRHCKVCGKAIALKKELCSDECINEWERTIRKRKNLLYMYISLIIIFLVVIMVAYRV
ncbi:MAG: DUF2116 family Zn-ribbon domain-containing protein [Candidatus Thermoplasmatota archaeon]